MKTILLSKTDKLVMVDDADYEWLSQWRWFFENGRASRQQYLGGGRDNRKVKTVKMHRLILDFPEGIVDHQDGNPLNNQRSNLRVCTYSDNVCNSKTREDNTSGYRNVYWNKQRNRWQVLVSKEKRTQHGGYYKHFEDAMGAAYGLRLFLFGEFANER